MNIALFSFEGTKHAQELCSCANFCKYAKRIWTLEPETGKAKPEISGDDDAEVTPVPMPNTEVKLCSAENTWWEAAWEDRSLPEQKNSSPKGLLFFYEKTGGEEKMGKRGRKKEEPEGKKAIDKVGRDVVY